MNIFISIFFSLVLSLQLFAHTHDEIKDYIVSVYSEDFKNDIQKIRNLDLDIPGVDLNANVIDVIVNLEDLQKLEALGLKLEIRSSRSVFRSPDEEYKNPQEIQAALELYHRHFPELTELREIGRTISDNPIFVLKIANKQKSNSNRPSILFNSMHHAREVMTPEISLDIIDYLLTNYSQDPNVTNWVDRYDIYVVPMLNVDGSQKVWDGNSMWRKNIFRRHGVDINRNYPYDWGACNGSSNNRRSDTYRGSGPGSEKETQALMQLVADIRPVFNISYHAFSEMVIYPYGCRPGMADEVVVSIGQEMGRRLDYSVGTAWELLYNVDGGDIDWMYHEHEVISYVLEVNSRLQGGFQPRYSRWRDATVQKNRAGWMYLFEQLENNRYSGSLKSGKDADYIEIYQGAKKLKTYQLSPSGGYHLILPQGEYQLNFYNRQKTHIKTQNITI